MLAFVLLFLGYIPLYQSLLRIPSVMWVFMFYVSLASSAVGWSVIFDCCFS